MNRKISNSIIYNVYPTSFFDSNGDGIGDLKGITEKLEYIKQFADIVWINPVYKSPFRDGGYDIEDYYAIDERFGTLDDVRILAKRAHELGIKVLFDLVVGHTSDTHKWFRESQKAEENAYSDYYIWNDDVFGACPYKHISGNSERNGNYLINFFCFQPALNYGFAEKKFDWQRRYTDKCFDRIHNEVISIIKFYMKLGIDGFRVDLASSIVKDDVGGKCSCEVWRKIFGKVREEYPEAIFVSEWGQPKYAVKNGGFDIDFLNHCFFDGYNKLFRKEAGTNVIKSEGNSFFRKAGKGECTEFFDYFTDNLKAVKDKGYISVMTGNHDFPRISMGRTDEELKAVFAFILALPNVPIIYYGDEIGMPYTQLKTKDGGYCRTGARTPMQWSADRNAGFSQTGGELYLPVNENYKRVNVCSMQSDANSLLNTVKKLVEIKRKYLCDFSADDGFELLKDTYPLVFKRESEKSVFFCAVNPADKEYEIVLPEEVRVLFSNNAQKSGKILKMGSVSFVWAVQKFDE
ncbi:MAG: glycosylase [Clostridia bacterium]|nr:glycosylase [Clostridia bacterium]